MEKENFKDLWIYIVIIIVVILLKIFIVAPIKVNGISMIDTLEDKDRGLKDTMSTDEILNIEVKHETAIPAGNYYIDITYSSRFKKQLPIILNVKGFDGIRFHSGNSDKDSSGCVILGQNRVVGKVINSRVTCDKFISLLTGAKNKQEKITLTIDLSVTNLNSDLKK